MLIFTMYCTIVRVCVSSSHVMTSVRNRKQTIKKHLLPMRDFRQSVFDAIIVVISNLLIPNKNTSTGN